MTIKLSYVKMKSIRTRINLIEKGREKVTISLPSKTLNKKKLMTSIMPNLIHSLDACNIHLLIKNVLDNKLNIPIYTIHDCFASTPNNMASLERLIKLTFLEIYFKGEYLEKMHNNILEQIKSFIKEDIIQKDGKNYISYKNNLILLPEIPDSFLNKKTNKIFIKGLMKSKYFIS
jgi:DNA-directed RNA polymerase